MKPLPRTEHPLVLRTDFTDPAAWEQVRAAILKPVGIMRHRAYVEFVDDPAYRDLTKEQLLGMVPKKFEHSFIIVADRITMAQREYPLLIVDLIDEPGREFRALPSRVQSIENNLSIANMDFFEFAESVGPDGVFRGFPRFPTTPPAEPPKRSQRDLAPLLARVKSWAEGQADIVGVVLVGSYARGAARADSDVDLVIITTDPNRYLDSPSFVETFGAVSKLEKEKWGKVSSLRVWYEDGLEIEFGLAPEDWMAQPYDPGTLQVMMKGYQVLFERDE